jgi:hypothetical protein
MSGERLEVLNNRDPQSPQNQQRVVAPLAATLPTDLSGPVTAIWPRLSGMESENALALCFWQSRQWHV